VTQAEVEPEVLHYEAVKAMLAGTGFPAYLGEHEIPEQPGWPYYVVWAAPGEPIAADERMRGYAGSITTRFQLTIAALTPTDVLGAAARARNALHRKRPTIAGRRCGDIAQDPGPPAVPTVDPTVKGPNGARIYVAFLFFSLDSTLQPTI
jgi:hypothetical protein